jgi:hypothetical protein
MRLGTFFIYSQKASRATTSRSWISAFESGRAPCFLRAGSYSPECVEAEFCEVRLSEYLGSPHTRCGIGLVICPKRLACPDPHTQWGTPPQGPPFPSRLVSKHMPSAKKMPICGIFKG